MSGLLIGSRFELSEVPPEALAEAVGLADENPAVRFVELRTTEDPPWPTFTVDAVRDEYRKRVSLGQVEH